jgi:hypothetical protein
MIIDTTDCVVQNNCSPRREIWISIATMLKTCSLKCAITVVASRFIHTPRNSESITLSNYPNYSSTHDRRLFCPQTRLPLIVYPKSGESLSLRVCGTFHHPFVATQGFAPNLRMTCASAKKGGCRNFCTLCDFQNAGYNHETNLSHFPRLNRYHQVGYHPGS